MKAHLKKFGILFVACCVTTQVSSRADRFEWSQGHGDLAVNYIDGSWRWHVEDGREVSSVIIRLNDVARNEIPDLPAFSFLGPAGDPVWIIPTIQTAGLPFLGISSEDTEAGTFVNNRFDLHLSSVEGPGDFLMWTTTGTGTPTILMNSRDGITEADKANVPAGGHFHQNWGFTSPGTHRVGYKASGELTGQTEPAQSTEAVYTFEVNVIKDGEADIEVAYEEGTLGFHVHNESSEVEYEPGHVALQASPATWQTIPEDDAFSFLGHAGSSTYVLPQGEAEGVLFLGLAAGEIAAGTFVNDQITLKLIEVEGPGELAYYEINQFGTPSVSFNSGDGITEADSVMVAAGSHAHRNWSFSEPGVYRVTLQAFGTLTSGAEISSEPVTFLFEVLPPVFLQEGEIELEVAFENGQWELGLLDEAAGRVLAADEAVLVLPAATGQTVPDDPAFAFLGSAGSPVFVLPQDETEGVLYLGIAGDEIAEGEFVNERVNLELLSVEGPGSFALYSVDSFGEPTVFMNSGNGVLPDDSFSISAGSHNHVNWAFSLPGEYRLSFKATGTLTSGNQLSASEPIVIRLLVQGSAPQNGPVLAASLLSDPERIEIHWEGRSGVSYQLQSRTSVDSGEWLDIGTRIPGEAGTQSTTADIAPDQLRIFQVVEIQP